MSQDVRAKLLEALRQQSHQFPVLMKQIEEACHQGKYRQMFLLVSELKQTGVWQPTEEEEELLEQFWWQYAN